MSYVQQRDYENLQRVCFVGAGEYGVPPLLPVGECDCENWIGFNFAKTCEEPELHAVHFFLDDYQFKRVWENPETYLRMLGKFQAVCTPDFSPYSDFPKAIQIYNHYRKHWCGAYWQMHGLTVIPTITWSSPDTLEWCFDGEPEHGVVATSSVGMFKTQEYRQWFMWGWEAMMQRLDPVKIFLRGDIPEELEHGRDRIVVLPRFTDKWKTAKETDELKIID